MSEPKQPDVTQIIKAIDDGDPKAADELLPIVYDELRRLAAAKLRHERVGLTLQPTALVHEAYLRLLGPDGKQTDWDHRGHFFAAAAESMRRILIDRARKRDRVKHGGGRDRVDLSHVDPAGTVGPGAADLLDLSDALEKLREEDADKARLVELRYYAGLTCQEAGAVLGVSRATADRWWSYARAFLFTELSESPNGDGDGAADATTDAKPDTNAKPDPGDG